MAWGPIEHQEQMVLGVGFREPFEERLQAPTVHPWQIQTETLSRRGLERSIQVGPLVGTPNDVGRTKALRTVALPVPVDEAKTGLVEGQDLQRLAWLSAAVLPYGLSYPIGKLFLKASCSSRSAFSCRERPVLSFTLRRLRSCPTPSG